MTNEHTTDNKQQTTRQEANFNALCDYIDGLNILQDKAKYYFDLPDFDEDTTATDLRDKLEDGNAFDIEIIYFGRAMEYLSENDNSLKESLSLAADMGYSPEDLSSEILASIHASEQSRRQWYEAEDKIDDFISDLDWDEPEEDEND